MNLKEKAILDGLCNIDPERVLKGEYFRTAIPLISNSLTEVVELVMENKSEVILQWRGISLIKFNFASLSFTDLSFTDQPEAEEWREAFKNVISLVLLNEKIRKFNRILDDFRMHIKDLDSIVKT